MKLVVSGMANKDIASHIGITIKTVEVHRARVMRKMGAQNLAKLVWMGLKIQRFAVQP
jgi:two-component system response regulator FixJ